MTKQKLIRQYLILFQAILRQIENKMKNNGITLVSLPKGFNDLKAYVIHIQHGEENGPDAIEYISLGTRPHEIILHGKSGTAYHYSAYDSQDYHVVADPVTLLTVANESIDQLTAPCKAKSNRKEDLIAAIAEYIGPDGNIPFENDFPFPAHPLGCITEVTENEIVVRAGRKQSRFPLEEQNVQILKSIIKTLNAYANYCRTEA